MLTSTTKKPKGRGATARRLFMLALMLITTICVSLGHATSIAADAAQPADCGTEPIRMADQTWESASFTTQVIRLILTHGYGCNVDVVPGTTAATESALSQNDVQIIAEQWSGRSPIIEQGIEKGDLRVVGDTLKGGAEQG